MYKSPQESNNYQFFSGNTSGATLSSFTSNSTFVTMSNSIMKPVDSFTGSSHLSRLSVVLHYESVASRCKAIEEYLNNARWNIKEWIEFFPNLMADIFGFDNRRCLFSLLMMQSNTRTGRIGSKLLQILPLTWKQ